MKKKSLFALSLACMAFVACSSDEDINSSSRDDNNKETALVSLKLDIANPYTKGNPATPPTLPGTEAEQKLNSLKVILAYAGNVKYEVDVPNLSAVSSATDGTTPSWNSDDSKLTFSAPLGTAKIYVYANVTEQADKDALAANTFATAVSGGETSAYYNETSGSESFFMSGVDDEEVEIENKTEGTAISANVNIERAAVKVSAECKGMELKNIQTGDGTSAPDEAGDATTGTEASPIGRVTEIGFQLRNTTNKFWLLANNGERSTDFNVVVNPDEDNESNVTVIDREKAGANKESGTELDNDSYTALTHLYCLENIYPTANESNEYTYVNFKALFVPAKVLTIEEITTSETPEAAAAEDAPTYKVKELTDRTSAENWESLTAETFYLVKDKGVYENCYILESELKSEGSMKSGIEIAELDKGTCTITGLRDITSVEKYEGGACWFKNNWLVSGTDDKNIYRNDWYNLKVKSITFPGSSTPSEEVATSNIELTVTVLPWNFFSQDVELK